MAKYMSPVRVNEDGYELHFPPPTGLGDLPYGIPNPFGESSNQLFPLGTELVYGLRTFRYAKMGSVAGAVGSIYQRVVPLAGHIDEVISSPAIGATTISFTPNTVTTDDLALDELADGYIYMNGTEAGLGQMYRIKSHPAITGATSGVITLWDAIRVAPHADLTATVIHNPYRNVIIHPSPATARMVGVCPIAVTANYYFWIQTKGLSPVLVDGTTIVAGEFVIASPGTVGGTGVDGACSKLVPTEAAPPTGGNRQVIGIVEVVVAAADYALINLQLD